MHIQIVGSNKMVGSSVPSRRGGVGDWQHRVPYAAVAWSLIYAALGVYWAVGGCGFPYTPETTSDGLEPLLGRFGPTAGWIVVMMAGIPAAPMGAAMLRGVRSRMLRHLLITAGVLLAGILLLLMTDLDYFLEGVYDYTFNYSLAQDYFGKIKVPLKGFYTFEQSAHCPIFEEPDKALKILLEDVLNGTNNLADR